MIFLALDIYNVNLGRVWDDFMSDVGFDGLNFRKQIESCKLQIGYSESHDKREIQ